jgi:hypothetical protein
MVRYFLVFNVFLNLKLRYSTQFSFEQRLVFNLPTSCVLCDSTLTLLFLVLMSVKLSL